MSAIDESCAPCSPVSASLVSASTMFGSEPDANETREATGSMHPLVGITLRVIPCVLSALVALQPQPALATLAGSLSSTNSQILAFIQGDFSNLAIYIGLAAAAFTMIVRRGQGFGWAMIVFAVGIVLKNVGWVMDSITDLAGGLH